MPEDTSADMRPTTRSGGIPPAPTGFGRTRRGPLVALAAASVIAIVSYATVATMLLDRPGPPMPGTWHTPAARALPPPSPAVSVEPSPSSEPVASESPRREGTRLVRAGTTGTPGASTPPPVATTSAAPVTVVVGSTVALAVPSMPGYLLRHQNYIARVDPITAQSKPLDRMDAQFVVRTGQVGSGCVSFESVNFPGHLLRQRDSLVRLERAEPNDVFGRAATFCPVATGDGFILRAADSPDRHLVVIGGWVRTEQVTAAQATVFRAVPPL